MPVWLQIVVYVVAILTLVMIHESGHFFTAKAFGIKVEEFFVGFGPRIWSIRRGETEYGLKALPFGGYVRIAGMNPFEEVPPDQISRTFQAKPIWQRTIVIATGPVTHFFMAILFAALIFGVIGIPSTFRPQIIEVERTLNGAPSPAARVGLRAGDTILAINGRPIPVSANPEAGVNRIISETRAHVGDPVVITIERGGRMYVYRVTPVVAPIDGQRVGRVGTTIGAETVAVQRANPITAVGRGAIVTFQTGKEVIRRLGDVFGPSGLRRIVNQVTGKVPRTTGDVQSVVGGGQTLVQAASIYGFWTTLLNLLVSFNVFIGILNLVPLPPLDGGHLGVLAYEKIRRRRPDVRKLIPLTALVAAFMIVFALSITYLDIVNPIQFR
jgi:membrane-associated protease RseP (regulator of RpoE activity)